MVMLTDSTIWDRSFFFLLGAVIGLVVGWTSYAWKEASAARREADRAWAECLRIEERLHMKPRNEGGFIKFRDHHRFIGNVALATVVTLAFYSAFQSQVAVNRTNNIIEGQERTQKCTESFVSSTLRSLNQRTKISVRQGQKNLDLQRAQAKFLTIVINPPPNDPNAGRRALREYFRALTDFNRAVTRVTQKAAEYPYPDADNYRDCLRASKNGN